ncbi:MAG: hypothetical protein VKO44_06085, partial [Cyanobacteriota bacterium]|nr:hypothetical protein [Cyanobacteriota bacterium]
FLIALLARGNAIFTLTWACDDLLSLADPTGAYFSQDQFSQLRFLGSAAIRLASWLGASFPTSGVLWNASHTAATVVFALALRRLWIPGSASIYGILIGLLFTLFPYHINLFAYQIQHLPMTACYLSGALGLATYNKRGAWQWLSALAIAGSLSYQTMISYYVAAGLILLIINLFQYASDENNSSFIHHAKPSFRYLKIICLAIILYLFLASLIVKLLGLPASTRSTFASADQWQDKVQLIYNHLKRTTFGIERSLGRSTKLMQSALWLTVSSGLAWQIVRQRAKRRKLVWFLPALALISAAAIAAAFLPTILLQHTSENPRNLMATVIFVGGFLSLSSLLTERRIKVLALALAALIGLSYALVTNSLSVDLARLSQRDLLNANRMVAQLNQLSGGPQHLRTVVFTGFFSPTAGLRGAEYFQSAFAVKWGQLAILQEATGQTFSQPTPADQHKAASLALNRPAWPAPGSVVVEGDLGLIVLSQPQAQPPSRP